MNGTTGEISFDWYGDRKNAAYRLLNVHKEKDTGEVNAKLVGTLYDDDNIEVNMSDIIWPGNLTKLVKGIYISSHLRVRKYLIFYHVTHEVFGPFFKTIRDKRAA